MIVPMKRLSVLCLSLDRDHTLEVLAELGVMHISHSAVPAGSRIEKAENHVGHIRRVVHDLLPHAEREPTGLSPEETVEAVWASIRRRRFLREEIRGLEEERDRIAPFGSFDPAEITGLAENGIHVSLYRCHPKLAIPPPPGTCRVEIARTGKAVHFAVVGRGRADIPDADEVAVPEHSLQEIEASIERMEIELAEERANARRFGGDYEGVRKTLAHAENHLALLRAKASMGRSGPVAYLRGYVPADAEPAIRAAAVHHGWAVLFEDPTPDENAPTLIRNPKWIRPIQLVFDFINIVPGYREVDISVPFLVFFSLFFAMIVGDAGYGMIFLLGALVGYAFLPKAPKGIWFLLTVMSICTILWGLLTGIVFGMETIPAMVERTRVPWLTDPDHQMVLCFLIGAVHITLAHGWNAVRYINDPRAMAEIGWICTTWVMFFTARTLVLGNDFPPSMMWVLGFGIFLILVFMTPVPRLKSDWVKHAMFPLNLISNFVDVVSYIRLFAVGLATFAMASAFNDMAREMGGIAGVFFLLFGHALNMILAGMGVLVHGIRLNALEFSGHLGQEWTGIKYAPFARTHGHPV